MDFITNNHLSQAMEYPIQDLAFEACEKIVYDGVEERDTMMLSSGFQHPVKALPGPSIIPRASDLPSQFSNNYNIGFSHNTNGSLAMQTREDSLIFDTTMSFPELQQPAFTSSIASQTWPPHTNTMCSTQDFRSPMALTNIELQQPLQATRKQTRRASKAPTMSAKKWKPAEDRIRQLFVDEERSYKLVMDIVNKEFGFTATQGLQVIDFLLMLTW